MRREWAFRFSSLLEAAPVSKRKSSSLGIARPRRANSGYVLALTALVVWFWWLLATSQTSLSGILPEPAPNASDEEPSPADTAGSLAAYGEYKDAEQKLADAQRS